MKNNLGHADVMKSHVFRDKKNNETYIVEFETRELKDDPQAEIIGANIILVPRNEPSETMEELKSRVKYREPENKRYFNSDSLANSGIALDFIGSDDQTFSLNTLLNRTNLSIDATLQSQMIKFIQDSIKENHKSHFSLPDDHFIKDESQEIDTSLYPQPALKDGFLQSILAGVSNSSPARTK